VKLSQLWATVFIKLCHGLTYQERCECMRRRWCVDAGRTRRKYWAPVTHQSPMTGIVRIDQTSFRASATVSQLCDDMVAWLWRLVLRYGSCTWTGVMEDRV